MRRKKKCLWQLRYFIESHILEMYFLQSQYVNFLSTVGPFVGPALDLVSYMDPGEKKKRKIC